MYLRASVQKPTRLEVLLRHFLRQARAAREERHGPVFIRAPPGRVEFLNSSQTVVPCDVQGVPRPDVWWWRVGSQGPAPDIPGLRHVRVQDGALVFSPFRAEDFRQDIHAAVYRCGARNSVGSIVSGDVHVRAAVNQEFDVQVYDEFVIKGNTGVLRCQIPSYVKEYVTVTSWVRDDGLVVHADSDSGGRFTVFSSGELHVRKVDPTSDSHRKYYCQAKHRLTGKLFRSTTVARLIIIDTHVNTAPRLTDRRPVVRARQGENVKIPCAAQGYPVPSYSWHRVEGGWQVALDSPAGRVSQSDGTLLFRRAQVSDGGKYVCVVNNSIGQDRMETQLVVTAPLTATVRPRRTLATEGAPATLNCTTTGHPVSSVVWLKNGQPVSSRVKMLTRETLHIPNVLRDDKGMYQCFALNDYDWAQDTAEITLGDDPPVLTHRFAEQTVDPGVPVSLKCTATGAPLPQITWTLDGEAVAETMRLRIGDFVTNDGQVNSFVNLTAATTEDGGRYQCHASNDAETVSHGARLNVRGPPLVRAMRNVSVLAGRTLMVHCPAAGYPLSQILWYKGDARLPQSKRQSVFRNGTLSVHRVERSGDEGGYRCVATGPSGKSASRDLYVSVMVAPVVGPFSFPANLKEGMRAIVTCSVLEGDSPVRIRWLRDGAPLAPDGRDVNVESSNEFSSTLFIKEVSYNHRGEYTCVASNSAASANFSSMMVVNVPPRWKVAPKEKAAVVSENVVIDCQAEGSPAPRIWWEKSSASRPSEYKVIISNSHIHALENGSLMVREAERNDSGFYLCQASNGVGSGISKVIELKVHVPARFKSAFNSKTLQKGNTAHIKCEVFGEKPLAIAWSKNGQPLAPKHDQRYDIKTSEAEESLTSQLEIQAVDRRDSALFACLGSNKHGQDETRTQLIIQETPGAPFNVRTSDVTSRSMVVTWDQPYTGNSHITSYRVQSKTSGMKWSGDIRENKVQGTVTTLTLRELRPTTAYIIRIQAENSLGAGDYSQEVQVTTDEEAPEGPPLNVQATPVSSTTLKVTWQPPKKEYQNGLLKGYYVGYKKHGSSDTYVYKTVDTTGSVKEEALLTSLQRSTKYTVLVQAFNEKGTGPPCEEIHLETFENDPPPPPSMSVFSTSSSSIQLQWNSNTNDEPTIMGYYIYIKVQHGTWEEHQVPAHQTTHTFQDLLCGTNYQFYVASFNKMGKSDPSEVMSAKTQGGPPVAPKRDAVLSVNGATLTVHLSSWSAAGCPIQSFTVQYRVQDVGEEDWVLVSDSIPAEQKVLVVPDLVPGKWYILRLASHSEAGTTEHDYTFSTFTRTGASIPPLNSLEGRKPAFYKSVSIMVPLLCVLAVIVLIVAVLAFIIPRRRRQAVPNHFIDACSEDKNLEAMSLSILKQTGSSLESASPNKEQLYYPSPYAMGQVQALGKQGGGCTDGEAAAAQTLKRTRREHIYEVPYPRWQTEEDNYSHMRDGTPAPVSNIYQTPRKAGLAARTNSDSAAQLAMEEQRLSRESRNHRLGFKSSSLASDNHSAADDSDSEGAAYTFRLTTNGSYGDHQEMSEAECDRDQHTRAKHLEALGIHVTPGYGIT
ncbi:cell adhesion molecule Dscam1-like [Dermacentor albipictus]|uniref:cell adhesion molecule Dscam1-like n=1 Tax=Dermacentor albipictus TaxID=60249 RepID=UPI0038FC3488